MSECLSYSIIVSFIWGGGRSWLAQIITKNLASLDDLLNVVTLIVAGPGPNLINIHLIGWE